jgi:hypothetical protein
MHAETFIEPRCVGVLHRYMERETVGCCIGGLGLGVLEQRGTDALASC